MNDRKEVQAHGFEWENEIKTNIYLASKDELDTLPYTGKTDLPAKFNHLDGIDLSVKTSGKKNTVCMGDCLRVFDSVSNPIHMAVINYSQELEQKKITTIIEMDLTDSRTLLFGSVTRSQIEELVNAVKSVPQNRKPTKEEKEKNEYLKKSLNKISKAIIFNIKCNSTQSRVQCSFNKFQDFINNNPTRIIAQSNTNEFRGGCISNQICSSRRVFKPK